MISIHHPSQYFWREGPTDFLNDPGYSFPQHLCICDVLLHRLPQYVLSLIFFISSIICLTKDRVRCATVYTVSLLSTLNARQGLRLAGEHWQQQYGNLEGAGVPHLTTSRSRLCRRSVRTPSHTPHIDAHTSVIFHRAGRQRGSQAQRLHGDARARDRRVRAARHDRHVRGGLQVE